MAQTLPSLRTNLDFFPSPVPDRPGLMIRDPYRYSETMLIIPPPLVECLGCFDGAQTDLDLRAALVRLTGDLRVGELEKSLLDSLNAAGFLENDVFAALKEARHREFAETATRRPAHAGSAYPGESDPLRATLNRYMDGASGNSSAALPRKLGIAAPHVSLEGGWQSYQAAYGALDAGDRERTFVVLGTSHYGEPQRFGLTRKPFVTPLGETEIALPLVNRLAQQAPGAVLMEDYCHSFEHSIEFQVVFLQHVFGPRIHILPILCGSFAQSIYVGGNPEDNEDVRRFFDALGELATAENELFWVLGIDMAHMGRRYGDSFICTADCGQMVLVAERDRRRIGCVTAGDADGFWDLVKENHDDLKWCGSSPLYTFLKAVPGMRGELLRYEQWNIDSQSVVSFAALSFSKQ